MIPFGNRRPYVPYAARMLVLVARTPDHSLHVHVHDDHTAEILDANQAVVHKRMPLDELDKKLAPYGFAGSDLIEC